MISQVTPLTLPHPGVTCGFSGKTVICVGAETSVAWWVVVLAVIGVLAIMAMFGFLFAYLIARGHAASGE